MKKINCLIILLFVLYGLPVRGALCSELEMAVEQTDKELRIAVSSGSIQLYGAVGQIVEIYNVTGVKVVSVKIDTEGQSVRLPSSKGYYLIKVGRIVRKISVG